MSDPHSMFLPVALMGAGAITLFLGVRWLAHHSEQRYGHPIFLNWINFVPLVGWGSFAWLTFGRDADVAILLGVSVLCLVLMLIHNVMRTNLATGLLVTAVQGLTVVPVAVYVAVFVLPVAVLLLIAKVFDPKQFEMVPPDTAHNRRLERIYGEMRTRHRRQRD